MGMGVASVPIEAAIVPQLTPQQAWRSQLLILTQATALAGAAPIPRLQEQPCRPGTCFQHVPRRMQQCSPEPPLFPAPRNNNLVGLLLFPAPRSNNNRRCRLARLRRRQTAMAGQDCPLPCHVADSVWPVAGLFARERTLLLVAHNILCIWPSHKVCMFGLGASTLQHWWNSREMCFPDASDSQMRSICLIFFPNGHCPPF